MNVNVTIPPFVTLPILHVTVPPASLQVPWLDVAETKLVPAGKGSVKITPVAVPGPLLVTIMV